MEQNGELREQLDESMSALTTTRLEASQLKLDMQKKDQELKDLR